MGAKSSKKGPGPTLIKVTNDEEEDAAFLEPSDDEYDCIEVDDNEWTDDQLMNDARPGRRRITEKGKAE
jgi:hypothetical protein